MIKTRWLLLGLTISLGLSVSGCGPFHVELADLGVPVIRLPIVVTRIQRLQQQPSRQIDSIVYLRGTVGDRAPLIDRQLYQLQDDTGSIWVLTEDDPLQSGDEVLLRGRVLFESVEVAGQQLGEVYIKELERLE